MKRKKAEKQYVYERDNKICSFCGKELLFKQVSLDHYLPKSKGGPDETFNFVLSCRKCNKMKKNHVPKNYKEVMIDLFKRAVEDGKIVGAGIKIKQRELKEITQKVYKVENIGEYTVFQSKDHRFYVKQNKIYKIVRVDTKYREEEW